MKTTKITLLWGLPASGKTTYASQFKSNILNKTMVIDGDNIWRRTKKKANFLAEVADNVALNISNRNHIVIDALVTTNETADDIITAIKKACKVPDNTDAELPAIYRNKKELQFEVVWFVKDIAACLHNDRGRRKINSTNTIENMPFEEPSKELIDKHNLKVVKEYVVKKPEWMAWAHEKSIRVEGSIMKSDTWSLGGTYGNCWDSEIRTVSGDPQPANFTEFDELLEQLCPGISFLQYKKLWNATVTTDEEGEGDYYGGHTSRAFYKCDLKKLYEMLGEMGVVKQE